MDYETGRRLDVLLEQSRDAQFERTMILKVIQKAFSNQYKAALEEINKEAK